MAEDPLDHLISATIAIEGEAARAQRPALPFSGKAGTPAPAAVPNHTFHMDSGTVSEDAPWPSEEGAPATLRPIVPSASMPQAPPLVSQLLQHPAPVASSQWAANPSHQGPPAPPHVAHLSPPVPLSAPSAMPAIIASAVGSPIPKPLSPPPRVSDDAIRSGAASSAFAASNAARDFEPRPAQARTDLSTTPQPRAEISRERVDYLWHDQIAEADILRAPALAKSEQKSEIEDEWLTSPGALVASTREHAQLRQTLQTSSAKSIDEVMRLYEESLDAGIDRVLCLVSGELGLSFEPIEMLRVTLSIITPFLANDSALKHAYDAAHEALKTPGGIAPSIATSHKDRVDEAMRHALRSASVSLDAVIDRALMEGRCFSRRKVFGGSLVRGVLQAAGGSRGRDTSHAVPCYLLDAAAEQLPLMRSLPVRMIVEVRPSQDAVEAHPLAFRVVALAREVTLSRSKH